MKPFLTDFLARARPYLKRHVILRRRNALEGQHPFAAVLSCSDSRVIPEEIFHCSIGDLFVIRTAGNTLGANETGSFEYAYHHLGIRTFIVLGHSKCGAVDAALHQEEGALLDVVRSHFDGHTEPDACSRCNALAVAKELSKRFEGQGVDVYALYYDVLEGSVEELASL